MKRRRRDPLVDIDDKENRGSEEGAEGNGMASDDDTVKEAVSNLDKNQAREKRRLPYSHRLHYHWAQLEADSSGFNIGSPLCPCPKAVRVLDLHNDRRYNSCPLALSEDPAAEARFAACAETYKTIEYNTFIKNGCLKLTEVELFFLSSSMTKNTSREWALVYLGLGSGTRFRSLRDMFFPELLVIAFDPLDEFFTATRDEVENDARRWTEDGTDFTFLTRCLEFEHDISWIREKIQDRKLLLISDIRGMSFKEDGHFDKEHDQEVQWDAIQRLRPIRSLVKFSFPSWAQYFDYAPGVVLKQVFCNWGSREVRLLIEGVPDKFICYNAWELYEKMNIHHEVLRGQVYASTRRPGCSACLCHCFDCTVLWDTVSAYAERNGMDPNAVLGEIIRYQVYTPAGDPWRGSDPWSLWSSKIASCGRSCAWWDVEDCLTRGRVMQAIAALEADERAGGEDRDWADIIHCLFNYQRDLAYRLKHGLRRPASRGDLIELLGSLAQPFTLLRTELNTLLDDEDDDTANVQTPESC